MLWSNIYSSIDTEWSWGGKYQIECKTRQKYLFSIYIPYNFIRSVCFYLRVCMDQKKWSIKYQWSHNIGRKSWQIFDLISLKVHHSLESDELYFKIMEGIEPISNSSFPRKSYKWRYSKVGTCITIYCIVHKRDVTGILKVED